jgi:hypothetical protein
MNAMGKTSKDIDAIVAPYDGQSGAPRFDLIIRSPQHATEFAAGLDKNLAAYNSGEANFNSLETAHLASLNRNLDGTFTEAHEQSEKARRLAHGHAKWHREALPTFEANTVESVRAALLALDAIRITEEFTVGPISFAGRIGLDGDEQYERVSNVVGKMQPHELRNVIATTLGNPADKNRKFIAAAAIRRLGEMNKTERDLVGFKHTDIAQQVWGEEWRQMQVSLAAAKQKANQIVARWRHRRSAASVTQFNTSAHDALKDGLAQAELDRLAARAK